MKRLSLLLFLLLALSAPAVHADPPALTYTISGVGAEIRDNVRAHLGAAPESSYERNSFLFSAKRLVEEGLNALGYYHARIEMDLDREQAPWRLEIRIDPGERVLIDKVDVRVTGEASSDGAFDQLLAENPLAAGQGLNHGSYEDFKTRLLSLGRERGYFDARLQRSQVSVDVDNRRAVIELYYDSGNRYRFGEVSFDPFPLNRKVLDQLQPFAPGDLFDVADLQEFQADLQRTEFFGSVLVQPLPHDTVSKTLPLHVKLEPGDRNHFRAGVGYNTDTEQRLSLSWRRPLVNRLGHGFSSMVEYSPIRPRTNLSYSIPMSHPLDDRLVLNARVENNQYGSIDSRQWEVGGNREWLRKGWVLSGGLRQLWEEWKVGQSERTNHYLLPGVSVAHTYRLGNPVDPRAGFSQWYILETGFDQAGSDLTLQRIYANWRAVFSLGERQRLVGRAELGAVNFSDNSRPDLAPSLSFFAGGSNSIRGYAYQSLGPREKGVDSEGEPRKFVVGGDRLAVGSAEYQYYVKPELRAAVFVDAGNAFDGTDFDPVVGAGIGAHYISPVGAIRVDLANSVSEADKKWRVHITMGAEF